MHYHTCPKCRRRYPCEHEDCRDTREFTCEHCWEWPFVEMQKATVIGFAMAQEVIRSFNQFSIR
jgi:hypothetical protein